MGGQRIVDPAQYYGACYDACTRDSYGHGWFVCLWSDGTCGITTCPSAHGDLGCVLADNVTASDFGDWDPSEMSRDEFISYCIEVFGTRIVAS